MVNMGVIGYGYWGPNLVRNFQETADARVVMVCDLKSENLAKVQKRYPAIQTTTQVEEIFKNPSIDAIAIATPVLTHYDLGLRALRAGKHVFMEKPLASNTAQALELIQEAEKRKRVFFVDHTFIYTDAVRKIKQFIESGHLANIYYYHSVPINFALF